MPKVRKTQWTNPSVLAFANGDDPVVTIEAKARELVLEAMEKGWSGPPFDPIKLAELLKIKITASGDVADARTIPHGKKSLHIQYNPNRPRGRIRFSIAHEIAHSLFEDCHEEVRYRHTPEPSTDIWQLESLCNIGASELVMPIGSNPHFQSEHITIQTVLELRKKYDVSTEALLIRLSKLTHEPLAMFCASKTSNSLDNNVFRVDYSIASKLWPHGNMTGITFNSDLLNECTAIGYSVVGPQTIQSNNTLVHIECVGLPPYPGKTFPRIAGFFSAKDRISHYLPHIDYHEGDATKPGGSGEKIIAHIVNDKTANWGGGGFAVSLKKRYPLSQKKFKEWVSFEDGSLDLGRSHFVTLEGGLHAFSMIAQHGYGRSTNPLIRYRALETCLTNLKFRAEKLGASIHMPRIGVGNAGGDWCVIEEIINDTLVNNGIKVNVYDFSPRSRNYSLQL